MGDMKNRCKILFLSNRSPLPIIDGHTRRTYNILQGLAKRHNVHLVTLYEIQDELNSKNVQNLKNFCEKVEFYPAPSKHFCFGMMLRLLRSLISRKPYTIWRHYSREYYLKVNELIDSGMYDIIHCDNLPIAYTCYQNQHVYRSITDHDVSYLKCARMARESNNILLKMFLFYEAIKLKFFEERALKLFDLGIVVSNVDKEELHKICPESNLLVIENGVDTEIFKPQENVESESSSLVWVGGFRSFSNENGMYFFLSEIYQDIKKNIPDVKLDIIGGDISTRMRRMLSNEPSIRYLGFVDDPLPYIQKAAIFIVPILSGGGTRLKLLEAMAVGKASVTTTIGCEGIEGFDGIHYVVADTAKKFSEAVVKLLKIHSERRILEVNARRLAIEKYQWPIILEKMNKHYMQIKGRI